MNFHWLIFLITIISISGICLFDISVITDKVKSLLGNQKFKRIVLITTGFMVVTHLYSWVNGVFLGDTSYIFRGHIWYAPGGDKWLQQLLWILDGNLNMPWLAGIMATLVMCVSMYLMIEVLEISSSLCIWMIIGLCVTNVSIIGQQQLTGGNYVGPLALMFSCLSVWIIEKTKLKKRYMILVSSMLLAASVGIYASYIGVTASLMIFKIVSEIMSDEDEREVWKKAIEYIFVLFLGIIFYYVVLRFILLFSGGQLNAYMGEDNISSVTGIFSMIKCIPGAYRYFFDFIVGRSYLYPTLLKAFQKIICVYGVCIFGVVVLTYKDIILSKKKNLLLLLLCVLFFPLANNNIFVLASGQVHFMMIFSLIMPYIGIIYITDQMATHKLDLHSLRFGYVKLRNAFATIICLFIYFSVVMANATYVAYYNQYEEALSISTGIINRIESIAEYDGTQQVVMVGKLADNNYYIKNDELQSYLLDGINGPYAAVNGISKYHSLHGIICRVLNSNINMVEGNETFFASRDCKIAEKIGAMPCYPSDGSILMEDDIIYVKLSQDI